MNTFQIIIAILATINLFFVFPLFLKINKKSITKFSQNMISIFGFGGEKYQAGGNMIIGSKNKIENKKDEHKKEKNDDPNVKLANSTYLLAFATLISAVVVLGASIIPIIFR